MCSLVLVWGRSRTAGPGIWLFSVYRPVERAGSGEQGHAGTDGRPGTEPAASGTRAAAEVTELIQGYVVAMNLETTEQELMHTVFPHPTLSETVGFAAEVAEGTVTDIVAPRKR